ncbi:hypothetical protein ACOZAE_22075, partial [Enterobacter asburiae]|uniref:hypothetical protein n=1 Tax=Enterobacter asburiae TaxID=61645 RepID=UPI003BC47FB7
APKVLGALKKSFNFMTLVSNYIISVRLFGRNHTHHEISNLIINQRLTKTTVWTLSDNIGRFNAPNHAPGSILPPDLPPKFTLLRSSFQLRNTPLYTPLPDKHNRHEPVYKT